MQTYKLKDLLSNVGEVDVINLIIILLIMIIAIILWQIVWKKIARMYSELKEYREIKKTMWEMAKDFCNKIEEDLKIERIIHKKWCGKMRFKEMSLDELQEELGLKVKKEPIKKKPTPEPKVKVKEKEPIKKEELKEKINEDLRDNKIVFRKQHWGKQASTDRETYPKTFKELEDLTDKLVRVLWVVWLGKSVWVTAASISWVRSGHITTKKTAKTYIKKFKQVLSDMPNIDQMADFIPWWPTHKISTWSEGKITEAQRLELNRLIDTMLSKMTQQELASRMWLSQPQVSDIARRKTSQSYTARMHIKKLQWIERMVLGAHISEGQL